MLQIKLHLINWWKVCLFYILVSVYNVSIKNMSGTIYRRYLKILSMMSYEILVFASVE